MSRLAILVQRCHASVVGGSEALAVHYAQLLGEAGHEVEILTSCAVDYLGWDNALPEGADAVEGIAVRRFATAFPRGRPFTELHRRLLADHAANALRPAHERVPWRTALAEEFIRAQGPWCPGLIEHLARHATDYAAVIGCTYLYAPTYFGLEAVPAARTALVPTLHDEPPACLPAYAERAEATRTLLWLTDAERNLGHTLWKIDRGHTVGMAVEAQATEPERRTRPYFLYCGRIDASKGCRELLEAFARLREADAADCELVLTGADHLGLPRRADVVFLGHVPAARKAALMAGCVAFVMPSPYESFSIVTLEAMAQGAPVIVNGDCVVLAGHVAAAGSGNTFHGVEDLAARMRAALGVDESARHAQADAARRYVATRYGRAAVRTRLVTALGEVLDG